MLAVRFDADTGEFWSADDAVVWPKSYFDGITVCPINEWFDDGAIECEVGELVVDVECMLYEWWCCWFAETDDAVEEFIECERDVGGFTLKWCVGECWWTPFAWMLRSACMCCIASLCVRLDLRSERN